MYFEATKSILSLSLEAIAKSRKIKRAQALKQATKHLSVMTDQWFAGDVPQIAYDDPLCRWAYVYAHVPAHANLFEKVLQICSQGFAGFRKILTGEELSVLVFGGGPGTELLGLAKYFQYNASDNVQTDIEFQLVDRVSAWSENLTSMQAEINKIYAEKFGPKKKWPARFNTSSYPLDFSDIDSFGNLPALFNKQLFVFSFVISEVFDLSILTPIMKAMIDGCPSREEIQAGMRAYFLFVDRADAATNEKVGELIADLKLKEIGDADIKGRMDTDEQKSVLSEFSNEIERAPRLTWNARWHLARKPKAA